MFYVLGLTVGYRSILAGFPFIKKLSSVAVQEEFEFVLRIGPHSVLRLV